MQGKAPKEIHAILTETLACFLPGRAKDLSAPPVRFLFSVRPHSYKILSISFSFSNTAVAEAWVKVTSVYNRNIKFNPRRLGLRFRVRDRNSSTSVLMKGRISCVCVCILQQRCYHQLLEWLQSHGTLMTAHKMWHMLWYSGHVHSSISVMLHTYWQAFALLPSKEFQSYR